MHEDVIETFSARGAIKYNGEKLLVGDFVETCDGVITKVYPRKTRLLRPNVANVDCVNIVLSLPPKPDYILIDKVVLSAISCGVEVLMTVNKCDLTKEVFNYVSVNYGEAVNKIFQVSTISGDGIDELKDYLKGRLCALIGQSAVGKTSLVNAMFNFENRVGDVSEKTQRGRHTTTSSEIFFCYGLKIIDTPGFSSMLCDVPSGKLKDCYPEFKKFADTCYYIGCLHISEPDCAVKIALDEGKISEDRYKRYIEIYKSAAEEEKYGKR